jgi:cell division protein FtsB
LRAYRPVSSEPDYGEAMEGSDRDAERDKAVQDHLAALDDEIARLRRMEAALDRRIAEADDERQAIEDETRRRGG